MHSSDERVVPFMKIKLRRTKTTLKKVKVAFWSEISSDLLAHAMTFIMTIVYTYISNMYMYMCIYMYIAIMQLGDGGTVIV